MHRCRNCGIILRERLVIQEALNADLPESYGKPVFDAKTNLLLPHFVDMAVQGYGWISAA